MLDIKYIRSHSQIVKQAIAEKNISLDLDALLSLDKKLSCLQQELQESQKLKNENAQQFQQADSSEKKAKFTELGRKISHKIAQIQSTLEQKKNQFQSLMLQVPNIPSTDSPVGKDDQFNKLIREVGKIKKNGEVKNHVEILTQNNWADFKRVASVCGSRSYCLKNEAVLLEQALIHWSTDYLVRKGFEIFSLPNFGDRSSFIGTGHFPEGEEQVYYIEKDKIYLTGTSEVILNSLYREEILMLDQLPLRLAGLSPCFRREAGSAGRDVRGLLRVHQFVKLEQYIICENSKEETDKWHEFLLQTSEEILQVLEIPYRVVIVSTGDMGAGKYRMHDIESWFPSLNKYVETHSCSSLLDWQARRTRLRYRDQNRKVHYCHTLNNTAIALPRLLASFLEVHQRSDSSIHIPLPIRKYLNGSDALFPFSTT